ncbi:hypothetical protein OBBRIDRAFT_807510 [Obba rivulosa]|uniref:Uncharacterized protein n=1 Tax=Obba rivulosa TaxID=1052685 RepID=A0A8E2AUB8_9APHY|nr:hypothetical protein OBBRIDRAFT_807510 [Obba rivulosa]
MIVDSREKAADRTILTGWALYRSETSEARLPPQGLDFHANSAEEIAGASCRRCRDAFLIYAHSGGGRVGQRVLGLQHIEGRNHELASPSRVRQDACAIVNYSDETYVRIQFFVPFLIGVMTIALNVFGYGRWKGNAWGQINAEPPILT